MVHRHIYYVLDLSRIKFLLMNFSLFIFVNEENISQFEPDKHFWF